MSVFFASQLLTSYLCSGTPERRTLIPVCDFFVHN